MEAREGGFFVVFILLVWYFRPSSQWFMSTCTFYSHELLVNKTVFNTATSVFLSSSFSPLHTHREYLSSVHLIPFPPLPCILRCKSQTEVNGWRGGAFDPDTHDCFASSNVKQQAGDTESVNDHYHCCLDERSDKRRASASHSPPLPTFGLKPPTLCAWAKSWFSFQRGFVCVLSREQIWLPTRAQHSFERFKTQTRLQRGWV